MTLTHKEVKEARKNYTPDHDTLRDISMSDEPSEWLEYGKIDGRPVAMTYTIWPDDDDWDETQKERPDVREIDWDEHASSVERLDCCDCCAESLSSLDCGKAEHVVYWMSEDKITSYATRHICQDCLDNSGKGEGWVLASSVDAA